VGVLAGVLALVREAGINVEGMRNTVFESAAAASAAVDLGAPPDAALLARIRGLAEVLFVDAIALG
jgi:D-3-phosphoglycerate dehydrogenase